jgi:hypothetical protein
VPVNVPLSVELAVRECVTPPKKSSPATAFSASLVIAALSLAFHDGIISFLVVWAVSFLTLSVATVWVWSAKSNAPEYESVILKTDPTQDYEIRLRHLAESLTRQREAEEQKQRKEQSR